LKPKVGTEPVATAVTSTVATTILTPLPSPIPSRIPPVGGAIPAPTVDPNAMRAAVIQAYLHYWDVYGQSARVGDTSQLPTVLTGDALKWTTDEINQRKAQGQGMDLQVKHLPTVRSVTADTAEIDDQVTDTSRWIDLKTGTILAREGSPTMLADTFQLQRIDGTWKVVSGTQNQVQINQQ
jgi:ARC6-like, IMS domain